MENRIKSTFRLSKEAVEALDAKRRELGVSQNAALEILLLNLCKSDGLPLVTAAPEKGSNLTAEAVEGWLSTVSATWETLLALTERKSNFATVLESQAKTQERLLLEHQEKLSEVMLTAEKATEDLKSLCGSVDLARVQGELVKFSQSLEGLRASHSLVLTAAVEDVAQQTHDNFLQTSIVIERARGEIEGFEKKYAFHQKEIETVVDRVKRGLKITPTVALCVVVVSSALAILVSVHFIPTFEKYQSDKLINETVTPVLRSEIKTAFEKMRAENQDVLKSYAESEQEHFEDFAKKYRGKIQVLTDEKVVLENEVKRVSQIANSNFSYSKDLEKEIHNLKSHTSCGVIAGEKSLSEKASRTGIALLFSPLMIWILSLVTPHFRQRKRRRLS